MIEEKRIVINGIDYTSYFTKTGYSVQYESVQGNNSGQMLDGSYTEDEIKIRTIITLPCMPLSQDKLGNILREVYAKPYHAVQYYNPMIGGYKTEQMRRFISTQKYKGDGSDGESYWTGTVITFTTR